jgi:hypothetical protein
MRKKHKRKPRGQSRMDNAETLATLSTRDTGQVDVRENRGGHQEWAIQRYGQHRVHRIHEKETLEKTEGTIKNG